MDLKHIIPQQRRRVYGPSLDIQYSVDRTNVPRVGPTPTFTRASSGTFVNENRRIVGKTTSNTPIRPLSTRLAGVVVFDVPSGSVVGWLNDSVVSVMVDSDGDDQIGLQSHVTGVLIHKTDTTITLRVTSRVGSTVISNWVVSYRGQRITHDPVTGRCLGTLIEQSRTNILLRSEAFNESTYWTPIRLVSQPVANTHISPDGVQSAEKLIPTTENNDHRIDRPTVTVVSGTTYACSVFVKPDGYSGFGINIGSSPQPIGATFSLTGNGSVTSTLTDWTASIQKFPDGWFRCSATFTAASTTVRVYFSAGINGTTFNYAGDGTSGIILWGSQLEAGLNATSYIPTTAAVAAARAQDLHTITGDNFLYMYNQSSGTVFCSHEVSPFNGTHGVYGITAPIRAAAGITAVRNNSTLLVTGVYSSPPNFNSQASFASSVSASGQTKSAIAVRTDDFAYSANGSISTDSSGTLNPIMDRFVIGATGNLSGPQVGSNIFSAIRYYRDRLPNAELQTLTSTVSETIVYNGVPILYNGTELIETT
jgi:hypothetical protein